MGEKKLGNRRQDDYGVHESRRGIIKLYFDLE